MTKSQKKRKLDQMKRYLEKAFWIAKELELDQTPSHIKICMDDIKADGEFKVEVFEYPQKRLRKRK